MTLTLEEFVDLHKKQLDSLNIPFPLYRGLKYQLEQVFAAQNDSGAHNDSHLDDIEVLSSKMGELLKSNRSEMINGSLEINTIDDNFGAIIVMPHICSWDMVESGQRGMLLALSRLPTSVLARIMKGLNELREKHVVESLIGDDRNELINSIADHPHTWSRVILYRSQNEDGSMTVRAALPTPPYYKQMEGSDTEADLVGPFPFQYIIPDVKDSETINSVTELSLAYVSPGILLQLDEHGNHKSLTLDLVPQYQYPEELHRAVRYVMFLAEECNISSKMIVEETFANFVKDMHLVRQRQLETCTNGTKSDECDFKLTESPTSFKLPLLKKLLVYTDSDDPMALNHPEAGLTANSPYFEITNNPEEADIIFSYTSLFAPNNNLRSLIESRNNNTSHPVLINQFPYEGAFVQKDHLARELLKQHGLPRPSWSIESYDLDVQLAQFAGAALLSNATTNGDGSVWIIKPANGTKSMGHIVTRSLAHILRIVDAGGCNRVVQRYITNPVCVDGRKIDCRCVVLVTNARQGCPILYMHSNVYFRIANKIHIIRNATDLADHEAVLSATHLLNETSRSSKETLRTLPLDHKTIAKLECDYPGSFEWNTKILPQIKRLVRELFNGMTNAYPAMATSAHSRAVYGVDIMFEIDDDGQIIPKLTEVTFCPANNAICEAYERDEELYRSYNKDIFEALFLEIISDRIVRMQ